MTLPNGTAGNTQISMGQMRTEFRNDSSPILMGQLYRGGALVPSTQTTTGTQNLGGTITKSASSGSGSGQDSGYSVTTTQALPQTIVAGDTYATNNTIVAFVNTQNGGGFTGASAVAYFSNSGGVAVMGGFLIQSVISSANSFSGSRSDNWTFSNTVNSSMVGATHFVYKLSGGGGGGQDSSSHSSSLTQGSITLVQNRTVSSTSNINATVPTGAVNDTEFQFSDMYGAFDV